MLPRLSKSKYLSGLQCPKRLWLKIHTPDKATPITNAQQRMFDQGQEVGKFARNQFPHGLLIKTNPTNLNQAVEDTKNAIANGANIIFEAAFLFKNIIVIADIIEKMPNKSWNIIEVKSSTAIKDEHIEDVALQKYILEKKRLKINKTYLMHINKECIYPNLTNFFVLEDITPYTKLKSQDVSNNLEHCQTILQQKNELNTLIGEQCNDPHECPFKSYCWKEIGNKSVFDIPRLNKFKKRELRLGNIMSLDQLPADYSLSELQWSYVSRILNNKKEIDNKAIQNELAKLTYPLYFLDFETDNPAIPRFNSSQPYQHFPFQFSCHILQKDKSIVHREYLHTDESDPRWDFAKSLFNTIGLNGSIIVYNKSFEASVLKKLAARFPDYSHQLLSMIDRLWDLLDIFKNYYKDPRFGKSNSIKSILPILVPELSYSSLAIQKGDEAQSIWNKMIKTTFKLEKERMMENLKNYCELDTLAMVEIYKKLLEID
jgi:hypothetical protein